MKRLEEMPNELFDLTQVSLAGRTNDADLARVGKAAKLATLILSDDLTGITDEGIELLANSPSSNSLQDFASWGTLTKVVVPEIGVCLRIDWGRLRHGSW